MKEYRNIVICCDGTGNEISENISNVLKFYRCLRKTEKTEPRQLAFYDPGVGTLERPDPWQKLKQDSMPSWGSPPAMGSMTTCSRPTPSWSELARGRPDLPVRLFRGAYTVRILAGLIHKIGLITPAGQSFAGSGLIAYKQFSSDEAPKLRAKYKSVTDAALPRTPSRPRRSTMPRNSRASPHRAGPPSASSVSGIRWRA